MTIKDKSKATQQGTFKLVEQLASKSASVFKGVLKVADSARTQVLAIAPQVSEGGDPARKAFVKAMHKDMVALGLPDGYARKQSSYFGTVIQAWKVKCELLIQTEEGAEPQPILADAEALKTVKGGYEAVVTLARAMLVKAGLRKTRGSGTGIVKKTKSVTEKGMKTVKAKLTAMTAIQLIELMYTCAEELRQRQGVPAEAAEKLTEAICGIELEMEEQKESNQVKNAVKQGNANDAEQNLKTAKNRTKKAGKLHKTEMQQSGPVVNIPVIAETGNTPEIPAMPDQQQNAA